MPLLSGTEIHILSSGSRIAVEFIGSFSLEMPRGTDAGEVKLLTSRPEEFNSIGAGACTFLFSHDKGDLGAGKQTFGWKGWFMESLQPNPSQPGLYTAVFRDARSMRARKRISVSYNVEWPDQYLRADTMTSSSTRWTCLNAAYDALEKFGFTVDKDSSTLTNWQKHEFLPNNLGNSQGGGFAGVNFIELIPLLLEPIRCDIIMTPENKVRVVSRSGKDDSPKLKAHRLIGGVVGERNIKWLKPKKVRVLFDRILEGGWDYTIGTSGATAAQVRGMNWQVNNVMPKFNSTKMAELDEWTDIEEQIRSEFAIADGEEYLCARWFKPSLFPYRRDRDRLITESPEGIAKKKWYNDGVRRCWRRLFQVNPRLFTTAFSYTRYFTGIRLGRLDENGGVVSGGNVYCDFTRHLKWGHNAHQQSADPMELRFSENVKLGFAGGYRSPDGLENIDFLPAPFNARWVSAEKLIFEVSPRKPNHVNEEEFYPALMSEHLNYGKVFELASGTALRRTPLQGTFKTAWNMRVLWNGRLVSNIAGMDILEGTGQRGRMWAETRTAFPDGLGEDVEVRVDEITANHVFSERLLRIINIGNIHTYTPDVLANKEEIEDVADHITEQIVQTYNQNRAGTAHVAGVSALAAGIWTGGAIHNVRLAVGEGGEQSALTTQYIVQPEIRPLTAKRKLRAGKRPAAAAEE